MIGTDEVDFPLKNIEDRELYYEKVVRDTTTPDGCWHFVGAINFLGFGEAQLGELWYPAHHIMAAYMAHKPIKEVYEVIQVCGNNDCVHPQHLRAIWKD